MDFLGVGPMEILVIIVIILIVFGPQRLPEMARQFGKAMKDVKNATSDLGKSLSAELEEEERLNKRDTKSKTFNPGQNPGSQAQKGSENQTIGQTAAKGEIAESVKNEKKEKL